MDSISTEINESLKNGDLELEETQQVLNFERIDDEINEADQAILQEDPLGSAPEPGEPHPEVRVRVDVLEGVPIPSDGRLAEECEEIDTPAVVKVENILPSSTTALEDNYEAEEEHTIRIIGVNSLQTIDDGTSRSLQAEYVTDFVVLKSSTDAEPGPSANVTQNDGEDIGDAEKPSAAVVVFKNKADWRKKNKSHKRKLSYILRAPQCNQDVVFIVGPAKERILAHSFVLWLNSSVFECILAKSPETSEGEGSRRMKEIILEDITPEVFKVVLKFMYTEEAKITVDNVEAVYKAAKKSFQIYELADCCQQVMKNNISIGSAVKILQLAQEFQEDELYQEALLFILQNGEMILCSSEFLTLSRENLGEVLGSDHLAACELSVFKAAIQWATSHCFLHEKKPTQENLREALDHIIYKIRFPLLTAEEFKVEVIPANILEPTEIIELFSYFTPPFLAVSANFPFSTTPRFQNEMEANVDSLMDLDTDNVTIYSDRNDDEGRNIINIASSSCSSDSGNKVLRKKKTPPESEDEDTDWKKSSEESSSDSSDVDFVPPPHLIRKRKQQRPPLPILPIKKKQFTCSMPGLAPVLNTNWNIPKFQEFTSRMTPKSEDQIELSTYIKQLMLLKTTGKNNILQINEKLNISQVPQLRVCLPNIKQFCLNLTSSRLQQSKNITEFKSIIIPLLRSMKDLIFFGKTEDNSGKVSYSDLDKLWVSGIRINININGLTVFRSNVHEGVISCCFIRSPALQNIIEGLIYRRDSLTRLTIAECEFRFFPAIPSASLRYLTILNVSGLNGINTFLQRCKKLRELHWDGNGVAYKIITLDEDLNLFSPTCQLRRLVISNALISMKTVFTLTSKAAVVAFPKFLFCEFSPHVIENFSRIFPYIQEIHFRNYPNISFLDKLLEIGSLEFIGIWGGKLFTEGQGGKGSSTKCSTYRGFISHKDLKSKLRKESMPNAVGKFGSFAFFLKRVPATSTTSSQWQVTETVRNLSTQTWDDEFLTIIYSSFQFLNMIEYNQFKKFFSSNY